MEMKQYEYTREIPTKEGWYNIRDREGNSQKAFISRSINGKDMLISTDHGLLIADTRFEYSKPFFELA